MSTQVNVRLNENLLKEIDAITKVLHISRNEWLRNKIAHAVKEDTLNYTEAIALEYAKGHISEREINELFGSDAKNIKFIVKHLQKGKNKIDKMVKKGNI